MKTEFVCLWFFVNVGRSEVVEHRIFGKEALEEAKKLAGYKGEDGDLLCRKCSLEENLYCIGKNVLHDHCCCDRKHQEKFPFIPHTCYVKLTATCEPVASDCEEYTRLYNCCCRTVTKNQWKRFSLAVAGNVGERKARVSNTVLWTLTGLHCYYRDIRTFLRLVFA